MHAEQLKLVLDSLASVQPIADPIAKSFYAHLFEVAPSAKKLFTGDMDRQGAMLMTSLSLAVSGLSSMEDVLPSVQALGERHEAVSAPSRVLACTPKTRTGPGRKV
jgi:hemoglobin-like flavoprotein